MESKIQQTENAIIQTTINGKWKSILTQENDEYGRMHIIQELYENGELREYKEYIF